MAEARGGADDKDDHVLLLRETRSGLAMPASGALGTRELKGNIRLEEATLPVVVAPNPR